MYKAVNRAIKALKPDGVMYASWKFGDGERVVERRYYADFTEQKIVALCDKFDNAKIIDVWITEDVRSENKDTRWVNVLIQKV